MAWILGSGSHDNPVRGKTIFDHILEIILNNHQARVKGLKERKVINRYAVRVAINPLISVMALEIPKIISESALVGIVMSLPTTGPLFLRALLTQDMYLAGTFLLFMTFVLMLANLLADVLLAWADPRIVYS